MQFAVQRRERSEADTALREAQLASLRGQLQPDLLIDALNALQARFARSQAEGDELFDAIVAFLRAAMPGVRLQASLLADELKTLRRYSVLCEALGRTGIRFGPTDYRAGNIGFPPLLLLPLIHLFTNEARPHAAPEVTTRAEGDRYLIVMAGAPTDTPIASALDALDAGVTAIGGSVAVSRSLTLIEIAIRLPLCAEEVVFAPALMSAQ